MIRLYTLLVIGIFSISCPTLQAQYLKPWQGKTFNLEEGLSSSKVRVTIQDNEGKIWIGTSNGLSCYDGYNFKTFKYKVGDNNSLGSNNVVSLLKISEDKIWVGTLRGGITIFNPYTEHFQRITKLPHTGDEDKPFYMNGLSMTRAAYDKERNIVWVAGYSRLVKITLDENQNPKSIIQANVSKVFPKNVGFTGIHCDEEGNIWFSSINGLALLRKGKDSLEKVQSNQKWNGIHDITEGKKNLWFATKKGLFYLEKGTFKVKKYPFGGNKLKRGIVKLEYNDNQLWFSFFSGEVQSFDLQNKKFSSTFYVGNVDAKTVVNCLSFDRDGGLWAGTEDGLAYYHQEAVFFNTIMERNGTTDFSLINTNLFYLFSNKGYVVACHSNGLTVFNPKKRKDIHHYDRYNKVEGEFIPNKLTKTVVDKRGRIWFSSIGNGLGYIEGEFPDKLKFIHEPIVIISNNAQGRKEFKLKGVKDLLYDEVNDYLWLTTTKNGLVRYNITDKSYKRYKTTDGLSSQENTCILHDDKKNVLWVGTENQGFMRIYLSNKSEIDSVRSYKGYVNDKDSLGCNYVSSIVKDNNNTYWVGTVGGGLYEVIDEEKGIFKSYLREGMIQDEDIFGMLPTDQGKLWFTGNNKIHYWDIENKKIQTYSPFQKRDNISFTHRGIASNYDGSLFFASKNGIAFFDPKNIPEIKKTPKLYFENLTLDGSIVYSKDTVNNRVILEKPLSQIDEIVLKRDEADFGITFNAVFYQDLRAVTYQYKIEGVHNKWLDLEKGRRTIYNSGLNHGRYLIKVRARINKGEWVNETSINLVILPAWWETIWFRLLVILTTFSIAFSYYKYRTYALKKRQRELEVQVDERTQEVRAQSEELFQQAEELQAQRDHLEKQNDIISEINENMTASIKYAQTIQEATLPFTEMFQKCFKEHFVFFRPKDIVSGDFYWVSEHKGKVYIAVVDCTGHGVPGAFMSMIGCSLLNKIVYEQELLKTHEILEALDKEIRKSLKQEKSMNDDGMDLVLCAFDKNQNKRVKDVYFTGAKNSLYVFNSKEQQIQEYKGDRRSIGGLHKKDKPFSYSTIQVNSNDILYLSTDGILDQNKADRRRLGKAGFMNMIQSIAQTEQDMEKQCSSVIDMLDKFQGSEKQRDDITVIGVTLS